MDWNHHYWINGRTEILSVSHRIRHSLANIIGHWLKLILILVHEVNYNVPINTRTCCVCKLVLQVDYIILAPLTTRSRSPHHSKRNNYHTLITITLAVTGDHDICINVQHFIVADARQLSCQLCRFICVLDSFLYFWAIDLSYLTAEGTLFI